MRKQGSSDFRGLAHLPPEIVEFRDWAHLPPEIVELISERVISIADYFRFRAVCYPWRAASLPKPRHLPPQLPWIMHPLIWDRRSWLFFNDVWEAKDRTFPLPGTQGGVNNCASEAKDRTFHRPGTERDVNTCACYRGWLLFEEYSGNEVFLINPLTRARIQLPPFAAPVRRLGDDSDVPSDNSLFDFTRRYYHSFSGSKMIFSTDLTDPNCLITVLISTLMGSFVICCRVGDPYWTRVDCCLGCVGRFYDVTYYNGRFFFLYPYGESMSIFDPNNSEEMIVPAPGLRGVRKHFVEGMSGVYVLAISREERFEECELYQFLEQPLKFERITDTINGTAIFYGDDYPCLAVCTDDWGSLDRVSAPEEHEWGLYAWNCTVGSHYSIYSAQRNMIRMREPCRLPLFQSGGNITWFQPSLI
ncbi:hypothetical protein LUZ63_015208 [Rhynchospora breviuscula]|uniref:KIB1-4 beta-propeller domain-containing protein n=1 Tax=Rhynchospora breviuscula TaxID=2022672 RepID=A0A9Q0CBV9_9POAL|nr:hypothetical protein LUZ63_015208 [Rhynchospora breviuscula]